MEDRKRIIPFLAIAFLVLVLMLPLRMVTAGELPRLTPSTEEELQKLFMDNAKEIVDLVLSYGSNGGGQRRRQAPATHFVRTYSYRYQVGTPPRSVTGALDIDTELMWTTQCNGFCSTCGGVTPTTRSSTTYVATESFTFGATRVDHLLFRCGRDNVIGLGWGPVSLASKLGRFSYYLAPNDDSHSGDTQTFFLFGNAATPQTKRTQATRLMLGSYDYPNSYLVGLTGIKVGGIDLPGIQRETFSGGVLLSIAVPVTFLAQSAYNLLEQALVSRIPLSRVPSTLGLDVCYASKSLATVKIPSMTLVFDGNAVMELEVGNYFYMDARTGVECLTIVPSPDAYRDVSLLGSLIQAGMHMIYDIRGSTLTFESLSSGPPPHILPLLVLFANFLWVAYMIM